jgi:hypothetical protein
MQAALWVISSGRCYAPRCANPVVYEVRPGFFRKNAQIAHIVPVEPGQPRYRPMDPREREAFANLILLCLAHHAEVDDRLIGERDYPESLLLDWKRQHEGANGSTLAQLGPISEDELTDLMIRDFTPPIERLEAIADQLQKTGTLNQESVAELKQIIGVIQDGGLGIDQRTAANLAAAAEMLGTREFSAAAAKLAHAAEVLPGALNTLKAREVYEY